MNIVLCKIWLLNNLLHLSGLLEYSDSELCLASLGSYRNLVLQKCDETREDQIIEVGVNEVHSNESAQIVPISIPNWELRMKRMRFRDELVFTYIFN